MNGSSTAWQPCPEGELSRLTGRLRRREQVRRVKQVAAAVAPLIVLLAAAWAGATWNPGPTQPINYHAGISCPEVVKAAPAFAASELSETRRLQILEHIEKCQRCRQLFRQRKLISGVQASELIRFVAENEEAICPCCGTKRKRSGKMPGPARLQVIAQERTFSSDTPFVAVRKADSDLRTTYVWHPVD